MIEAKINHLHTLRDKLSDKKESEQIIEKAFQSNRWFTPLNVKYSLDHIIHHYLNKETLSKWMANYDLDNWRGSEKCVGQIMAGNLPLVGFHDFLCAYILGFKQEIKLSSKDNILFRHIYEKLAETDTGLKDRVKLVDILKNHDIVIATGSNNSNRYFEYYFREKPKILRRNRNSIAVLEGDEDSTELEALSQDMFLYFGLGCRSVSKIYLPESMDIDRIIDHTTDFLWMKDHSSYMHNFDYNLSLLILNSKQYKANDFSIWVEDNLIASPLATVHYEFYTNKEELNHNISEEKNNIQCIVGKSDKLCSIPYGESQKPTLIDYADDIDVIKFLIEA